MINSLSDMHEPYEARKGHPPDFRVTYRFYDKSEGGRRITPVQGYRSDFWYFHEEEPNHKVIYMIWPEFEDDQGNVITDTENHVRPSGTARMWVIVPEMRQKHRERIKLGMKGYFMEGLRRVAECEVIELVGLASNPDT